MLSGISFLRNPAESRSDGTYWSLYVKDVPAFGYAQYYIKVKDEPRPAVQLADKLENAHVENPWYAIDFNTRKGTFVN